MLLPIFSAYILPKIDYFIPLDASVEIKLIDSINSTGFWCHCK